MTKKKLFQKVADSEARKPRGFRATNKEWESIQKEASVRNLTANDYLIRAALGRRADVRIETEIIIALRDVVAAIRALHASVVELKLQPLKEEWGVIIDEACAAMRRITTKSDLTKK